MLRTDAQDDRPHLGFTEEALAAFDFLTRDYGFRCVSAESTLVRYEAPALFVNVYHGRASFELGMEIGFLARGASEVERPFSLGELIELRDAERKTAYTPLQASTAERVRKLVPQLAELVREYAGSSLKGDLHTFEELAEVRSRRSNRYINDMKLRQVRREADELWRAKDYTRVVELYECVQQDLTPSERKRLEYARKHL